MILNISYQPNDKNIYMIYYQNRLVHYLQTHGVMYHT